MSWQSFIFPRTKLITSSKYNPLIRVNEEYGQYKLLVNGSRQSGMYIQKLWREALKNLAITPDLPIHSILVLGVAGGTVIHELHELYPQARITGVDIDEVMLQIGKKYFRLDKIPRLSLKNANAEEFISKAVYVKEKYDLIVIDLFIGRNIPDFVAQKEFLQKIKTLISPSGTLLINYLRELAYAEKSEELLFTLKSLFSVVRDTKIARNRFFVAGGK